MQSAPGLKWLLYPDAHNSVLSALHPVCTPLGIPSLNKGRSQLQGIRDKKAKEHVFCRWLTENSNHLGIITVLKQCHNKLHLTHSINSSFSYKTPYHQGCWFLLGFPTSSFCFPGLQGLYLVLWLHVFKVLTSDCQGQFS